MEAVELFDNDISENINSEILEIADYIYTQTTLKPMSKTVFFLSRILLQIKFGLTRKTYASFIKQHNICDDYDFWEIYDNLTTDNKNYLLKKIQKILSISQGDILGNIFNTLIHGKFEAGEGLGSFLTPDEVVLPTVKLADYIIKKYNIDTSNKFIGDITGGTGNFLLHYYKLNSNLDINLLKLYDQSSLHLGFANINFLLHYQNTPCSRWTKDSLTDPQIEKEKYCCLLTNPPFGANTYIVNYNLDETYKNIIGFREKVDPAWLFLIKNLEILSDQGILAIVLPNGVYQSQKFLELLKFFESKEKCKLSIPYIFDLPTDTFSLTGTVAKTGVVFLTKNVKIDKTFHYNIESVGFRKKGTTKIKTDNQYAEIVNKIINNSLFDTFYNWKDVKYLHEFIPTSVDITKKVYELSDRIKNYVKKENFNYIHIPVDAVDEYGIIHFNQCLINKMPKSAPIACQSNDILVSCLNPKIWRVVKVPNFPNIKWNCSPEFIVLRAKDNPDDLFAFLKSSDVQKQALYLAKGTSSSRQRINKEDFLNININTQQKQSIDIRKYEQIHKYLYEYINPLSNNL